MTAFKRTFLICLGLLVLFYIGQYTASPVPVIMVDSTDYCDSLVRVNKFLHEELRIKNKRIEEVLIINGFLVDSINSHAKTP